MTTYYTTREWAKLDTETKLAFRTVRRITFRRAGKLVTEWEAMS